MFSADLSWADPATEKVGERRERIAKERSIHSATSSIISSTSSRASASSIADDRELWWTSSLRKAKGLTRNKKARPPSSSLRFAEREQPQELRDPSLQPAWTYSSSLSSTLPSGAPLDPPKYEVPELEGDFSSGGTNSIKSRSSQDRRWSLKHTGKLKIFDEIDEIQPRSPHSVASGTDTARTEDFASTDVGHDKKKKNRSVKIDAYTGLKGLRLQDQPEKDVVPVPHTDAQRSYSSGFASSKLVAWVPPSDWNILQPKETQDPEEIQEQDKRLPPTPVLDGIAIAHSSLLELTRFQRFIRRMENAGPKVILDRLKEEWDDPVDEEATEEMLLEKRLWVLTAFQLQSMGRLQGNPQPKCNTGKILEMYGNLAEVYQLSAMHPRQKVQYLTSEPQRPMPLPGNVSYTTVPQPGIVPCPWSDATFSHIRASTLPSLVPSSELPQLLRECYRLLAPGGLLEIRVMDAAPVRKTAGPLLRAWIEDRLSINLEKTFRCSKPCMLFPGWVADAGFDLSSSAGQTQIMKLPCAFDESSCDTDLELKMLVGRALWKDIWGACVEDDPGQSQFWWDINEIVEECIENHTVFECGVIFAYKQ